VTNLRPLRLCGLVFLVGCGAPAAVAPAPPPPRNAAPIAAAPRPAWSDAESPVPVSSEDPCLGEREAPVTLVEFDDFQTPEANRLDDELTALRGEYGSKVRLVWKNYPIDSVHPLARLAAVVGRGVFELKGSEAFFRFRATAVKNQASLSPERLQEWARDAGVDDMAKLAQGLKDKVWEAKVDEDKKLADDLGIDATPTLFVNGLGWEGTPPLDLMRGVIDAELLKAIQKLAGGLPRDRLYVTLSTENHKAALAAAEEREEEPPEDSKTVWKVPVGTSPARGPATALVTLVEFGDFQCPYCVKAEATLKELRDKYKDDLRIVWKDEPLPFHPRAEPAAELAREARAEKGDAAFWAAHDALFAIGGKLDDEALEAVAKGAGLDVARVKAAMAAHKYKKTFDDDVGVADDFDAIGTPSFFVNGRRVTGAQPRETFEGIIDAEIAHARELLAAGTAPKALYDALIKDGKGPPAPEKKTVAANPRAPSRGSAQAKVTIEEFGDFQCPFCGRAEDPVKEIMHDYGARVRFVWRNLPLPMHEHAELAAEAALEALRQKGAAGFWQMHDKMFADQRHLDRATLDGYATAIGLDMGQWASALDAGTHKAEVDADAKAASDAGIQGTPTFVINGYLVVGAQPVVKFRKIVDRALGEAK
jgi:protein-disulfide isomerase